MLAFDAKSFSTQAFSAQAFAIEVVFDKPLESAGGAGVAALRRQRNARIERQNNELIHALVGIVLSGVLDQ